MAYLSLYRKHRPQTFAEILGQEHVAQTLSNAIREDRVAHAYLFTGPRGTGKTSTARILAKALNCEFGPTPDPCGKCNSCVAIAGGSSLDVIELDAASHSGVDDTREILQGVALATAGSRVKVYVIDEVHMLTTPSFNALLKTLEEPPPHVIFILATTEAHKVLHTIQSRTQRFDFRPIPVPVLRDHLARVAESEGIEIDSEAVEIIARHAEGGARDALSILDQLSSLADSIGADDVERLLGGREEEAFVGLFEAIAAGDVGGVFWSVHTMVTGGADARRLARGALGHARSLLLLRTAPGAEELLDAPENDRVALAAQAERFSPGTLVRIIDLLGTAMTDMREAPNHRLLLEVALVRAVAPDTDPSGTGLLGRIERLERRIGIDDRAAEPVEETPPAAAAAPAAGAPAVPTQRPKTKPREEPKSPIPASVPAEVGFGHVKDSWPATLREVGRQSKRVAALLNPSRPVSYEGDTLTVEVQSEFHAESLAADRNRSMLADALLAALGIKPTVVFTPQGASGPPQPPQDAGSPQATTAARDEDDYSETEPAGDGEHDPVELVRKGFGAEIVEER